jgi:hypothetical protein
VLEPTQDEEQLVERIAALDIGKAEVVCCVRVPDPAASGKRLQEITTHTTMTRSLLALCDRLRQVGVTRVIMEATGLLESAVLPAGSGRVRSVAGQRPRRQASAGPAEDGQDRRGVVVQGRRTRDGPGQFRAAATDPGAA